MAAADAEVIRLDDPDIEVHLRVTAQARRFTLRLDPSGTAAQLTLPPGVPLTQARMFVMRQSDWLKGALARHPGCVRVAQGARLPVAGETVEVRVLPGVRRAPELDGGQLILRGPGAPGPRVAAWLTERARAELVPAARRYSRMLGREPGPITLRDTRSRWGSCSSEGRLSFSWRLAMAPPEVLDYVAAHEAAHLVEMSHAPRFWAVLEKLMPGYRRPRAWLKAEGRALHAYLFTLD